MLHKTSRHMASLGRHTLFAVPILVLFAHLGAQHAHAQIYLVANCNEYYTSPLGTGSAAYGEGSVPNARANTSVKEYIVHAGTLNVGSSEVTVPYGLLFGNFLSPNTQVATNQPTVFPVGYSGPYRMPMDMLDKTWFLSGREITFYGPGNLAIAADAAAGTPAEDVPPPPTCNPTFVPATTLAFSQPGTYTHQFLGQVNAGPPAEDASGVITSTVTAFTTNPSLTLANLTYLPNDPANPTNDVNPNSIYGDITLTQPATNALPFLIQLNVNGVAATRGLVSISYSGTLTTPDPTTTSLNISSPDVQLGASATLTAQVADTPNPSSTPAGAILFYDTLNGVQTTIATVPATGGSASTSYQPTAGGDHTLTAVFTPNDATAFSTSTSTLAQPVFVGLGQVWVLNSNSTVSAFSQLGAPVYSGLGTAGRPSALGSIASDASGTIWAVASHNFFVNQVSDAGVAANPLRGGVNAPAALAIDGAGTVWIANSGDNSLTLFSNSGTALSGPAGYAGSTLATPRRHRHRPQRQRLDRQFHQQLRHRTPRSRHPGRHSNRNRCHQQHPRGQTLNALRLFSPCGVTP